MQRSRFSAEPNIGLLKEAERFERNRAVCARHNVTEQICFWWRKKFGGMDVADARKPEELERENSELARRVAEQALDIRMLKALNSKKWCAWRSGDEARSAWKQPSA